MMVGLFHAGWILVVFALVGFAYIVFTFANKESGWVKTVGQIIAAVIAILAIISLLSGGYYCKMGRGGKMGGHMMKGKMWMCPMAPSDKEAPVPTMKMPAKKAK